MELIMLFTMKLKIFGVVQMYFRIIVEYIHSDSKLITLLLRHTDEEQSLFILFVGS